MEDLIPILIFVFIIFGGAIKNILKKLSDHGEKPEPGAKPTLTGQLRDLLQDEEDEKAPPPRPQATSLPARPTTRPLTQPVSQSQRPTMPPRPTAQPTRPTPAPAPRPVAQPTPQTAARQARSMPSAQPAAKAPRSQPIQAHTTMPPAKPQPRATARVQRKAQVALPTHKRTQKITTSRKATSRGRKQGHSVAMRLNRKTLGAAIVISEIINPPLALRDQSAPWEE